MKLGAIGLLKGRLLEVLQAVAPLLLSAVILQLTIVQAPASIFLRFLGGALLAVVGMLLLFVGIDMGILPMGRFLGAELPRKGSLALVLGVGFALAFATTVAEPDVLVLARQVDLISEGELRGSLLVYAMAGGVGLFTVLALARVVVGFSMAKLLAVAYASMLALSFAAPEPFVAIAYDAGSVTMGILAAPVVLAYALGLSSVLAARSSLDGFGLLGFASVGPIIVLLLLGMIVG